jgi:hypothetical protein
MIPCMCACLPACLPADFTKPIDVKSASDAVIICEAGTAPNNIHTDENNGDQPNSST